MVLSWRSLPCSLASDRPPRWIREFPPSLWFMRPEFGGREIWSHLIMLRQNAEGKSVCYQALSET
jgi:hypothetical protein